MKSLETLRFRFSTFPRGTSRPSLHRGTILRRLLFDRCCCSYTTCNHL